MQKKNTQEQMQNTRSDVEKFLFLYTLGTCTHCFQVLHQTHFMLPEPISRKSVAGKAQAWICLPGIRWICVVTVDGSSFFWRVCNISPTMWHQSVLCANCENIYFITIVLYVWLFMRSNVLELNINLVPPKLLHWSPVRICEHFKNTKIYVWEGFINFLMTSYF